MFELETPTTAGLSPSSVLSIGPNTGSRGFCSLQVNLAASEGGITSEANVTDIHEALNFDQNDSVSALRHLIPAQGA